MAWNENSDRDLYVKRFDGITWTALGGTLVQFRSAPPEVFTIGNELHLLRQEDFSFLYEPTVLVWNEGTTTWTPLGASPLNTEQAFSGFSRKTSWLVLDNNNPNVIVRERIAGVLTLARYSWSGGPNWTRQGVAAPTDITADDDGLYASGAYRYWLQADGLAGGSVIRRVEF
jgi:hypothetical protein